MIVIDTIELWLIYKRWASWIKQHVAYKNCFGKKKIVYAFLFTQKKKLIVVCFAWKK